jgi:hypothetical protein
MPLDDQPDPAQPDPAQPDPAQPDPTDPDQDEIDELDPDAPGRWLFEPDEDAPEPNEPG